MVLSANAARTCGDEAAAGRMDLGRPFCRNAIMGRGVAFAILHRGNCDVDLALSGRSGGSRISRCFDCAERVRTESAESASGHSCPHGHAAGVRDFSDRLSYLAENSKTGSVDTEGSILDLRTAHRCDVNQGTDCLCVSTSRDRPV